VVTVLPRVLTTEQRSPPSRTPLLLSCVVVARAVRCGAGFGDRSRSCVTRATTGPELRGVCFVAFGVLVVGACELGAVLSGRAVTSGGVTGAVVTGAGVTAGMVFCGVVTGAVVPGVLGWFTSFGLCLACPEGAGLEGSCGFGVALDVGVDCCAEPLLGAGGRSPAEAGELRTAPSTQPATAKPTAMNSFADGQGNARQKRRTDFVPLTPSPPSGLG
jgi:hypothetical protein